MKPDLRFLVSHPAHALALGFGSGLPPRAPGTFGTIFGLVVFVLVDPWVMRTFGMAGWVAILAVGFAIGCWACTKTGRDLGAADHGAMVWDEIVAIWLVLLFTPIGWTWTLTAFVLFRFFDVVKPAPIRRFERRFKAGGWAGFGVMGDDLIAAFYALIALAFVVRVVQWIGAR